MTDHKGNEKTWDKISSPVGSGFLPSQPGVWAEAPSNIALIKYMGKTDASINKATNSSLSLTLPYLRTRVEILPLAGGTQDLWEGLNQSEFLAPRLSEKGQHRYLRHFQFLKSKFSLNGNFKIQSGNNFFSDCGLASSASSFAALTAACFKLAELLGQQSESSPLEMAQASMLGSGSSCRSFFAPLSLWQAENVQAVATDLEFLHAVVVVDEGKKMVSSSEAHQRVSSSSLFVGRPERAEQRLSELLVALKKDKWVKAFELVWAEFWDMHALFETASPPFGYLVPASLDCLQRVRNFWEQEGDGPLVTMDAGANVHLIFKNTHQDLFAKLADRLKGYRILSHGIK